MLYGVKGCSHCDARADCPKALKNSLVNLLPTLRIVTDNGVRWQTFCADFIRL